MSANFAPSHFYYIELVLKAIELEHVRYSNRSLVDAAIKGKGSVERNFGTGNL